jgi:hypothetical protein
VVPSALAENALYFTTGCGSDLLMYDLATQEISAINPPVSLDAERCAIITMDTGRLGFATVKDFKLYLWSREVGLEGDVGWTQSRVTDLKKLLPICPHSYQNRAYTLRPKIFAPFDFYRSHLTILLIQNIYENTKIIMIHLKYIL